MSNKTTIKPKEAQILKELKQLISKTIPQVDAIKWDIVRVQVEGDNIIGLGLWNCHLKIFPKSFGDLKSLQKLDLGGNQLMALPESFGRLESLQELYLHQNQLMGLPESFGKLQSLRTLVLKKNQLKTVPESLLTPKNLNSIDVNKNPLDKAAKRILKQLKKQGVTFLDEKRNGFWY